MNQKPMVLVTGAGRGIGAATARQLAKEGYVVCINFLRDEVSASEVKKSIVLAGGEAFLMQADVSTEEGVRELFEAIDAYPARFMALVNNAAMLQPQSRLVEMTAARINQLLTTNVTSAFLCAREAIKRLSTHFGGIGGSIVNVSSAAARLGSAGEYIDYAASKGAIDTLTKGLSLEVAAEGIRVNAVRPGFIYTDMHASGGEPGRVDRIKSGLPMQRGGQPEEVAEAICWLISDKASYVTGSFVEVAGGR